MNTLQYEIFKLRGIIKDVDPVELMNGVAPGKGMPIPAVWTNGQNVRFNNEDTVRVGGYAGFADPLPAGAQPIFVVNILTPEIAYWLWVDGQVDSSPVIYVTDGVAHYDITPVAGLTGGVPGVWSSAVLNGVPVLNNGVDAPFWWDGDTSAPCTDLPGWPVNQRCKAIRAYKYNLLALNITRQVDLVDIQYTNLYAWSNSADPGTIPDEWVAAPENDAGENTVFSKSGAILDGMSLRDNFYIYTARATFVLSYVGGNFVFSTRKLFNTSGIQALNCVQELRGRHWVFTDDDIIVHDGNTFHSIADKRIRHFVANGINPDEQLLSLVVANVPTDEIWFCLPTVNDAKLSIALIYSFTDETWGVRDIPLVTHIAAGILPKADLSGEWDTVNNEWEKDITFWGQANYSVTNDNLLMCSPGNSKLYNVDALGSNDGEDIFSFVERLDWTLGGEGAIWDNVMVRAVYPSISGVPGEIINVRVGGTKMPNIPVQWSNPIPFVIGSTKKIDAFAHGRFFNIRFEAVGSSVWKLGKLGVEFINGSKY